MSAQLRKLYPSHIPTTLLQKVVLTAGSALAAVTNPARDGAKLHWNINKNRIAFHLDMVACMGETTSHFALQEIHKRMFKHETGRRILVYTQFIFSGILKRRLI